MTQSSRQIHEGRQKQHLENGQVHDWYRFVLAFPDHLVREMLEQLGASEGDTVLDPFCGTGTTLVESMRLGMRAVGIEANPVCFLASRVKTNWDVSIPKLESALKRVIETASPYSETLSQADLPLFSDQTKVDEIKNELLDESPEGIYFVQSGMLERRWISEIPFYKTLAVLQGIKRIRTSQAVRETLLLSLASILVSNVGNIKFGPELYVSGSKQDSDVLGIFSSKVTKVVGDLHVVQSLHHLPSSVTMGDSRNCDRLLHEADIHEVDWVITSPPYPTEKDYTRQTRLELVFLGYVFDRQSLQSVKKEMLRSHSKGIYKADQDGEYVKDIPEIQSIANELREKVADKTYGFAKLYPRIIEEYFGGMYRHLEGLFRVMRKGGKTAYVVGDQRTYLQTYTPTGEILALIADRIGFTVIDRPVWRVRVGTTGSGVQLNEEILILEKP